MKVINTMIEKNAKEALSLIIDYIGADKEYKDYAQLITYIEWAIKKSM